MAQPTSCGTLGTGKDSICIVGTLPIDDLNDSDDPLGFITLDPALVYECVHDGVHAPEVTDNSTIYLGVNGLPTADGYPESGSYRLTPGAAVRIGPRVGKLWFCTKASSGTPTFSITANELRR